MEAVNCFRFQRTKIGNTLIHIYLLALCCCQWLGSNQVYPNGCYSHCGRLVCRLLIHCPMFDLLLLVTLVLGHLWTHLENSYCLTGHASHKDLINGLSNIGGSWFCSITLFIFLVSEYYKYVTIHLGNVSYIVTGWIVSYGTIIVFFILQFFAI